MFGTPAPAWRLAFGARVAASAPVATLCQARCSTARLHTSSREQLAGAVCRRRRAVWGVCGGGGVGWCAEPARVHAEKARARWIDPPRARASTRRATPSERRSVDDLRGAPPPSSSHLPLALAVPLAWLLSPGLLDCARCSSFQTTASTAGGAASGRRKWGACASHWA